MKIDLLKSYISIRNGIKKIITKTSRINCPKCETEMMPGRFSANGMVWTGKECDEVFEKVVKGCEALPPFGVVALRCPNCSKVEVYTADDEKA